MKKIIFSIALIGALGLMACKSEVKKEVDNSSEAVSKELAVTDLTFGVRGNCSMCKKTIEKAANGVDGVVKASWDVNKKKIDVSFDGSKTNEMAIHNAIAASGYDTEKVDADSNAYSDLPECCQYDHAMAMNQSGETQSEDHDHHDH